MKKQDKSNKTEKKQKQDNPIGIKNILLIIGFAVILFVAIALIFSPKIGVTGDTISENVQKESCGEGTVIYEGDTTLCWQQSVMPGTAKNWEHAKSYCENLELSGENDWRLPTLKEMEKIVEKDVSGIKINRKYFRDTEKRHYWTSTPYEFLENAHMYIHFENAYEGYAFNFKSDYGVRCVRTNSIS